LREPKDQQKMIGKALNHNPEIGVA